MPPVWQNVALDTPHTQPHLIWQQVPKAFQPDLGRLCGQSWMIIPGWLVGWLVGCLVDWFKRSTLPVGIPIGSFWDGLFSGARLGFRGCIPGYLITNLGWFETNSLHLKYRGWKRIIGFPFGKAENCHQQYHLGYPKKKTYQLVDIAVF